MGFPFNFCRCGLSLILFSGSISAQEPPKTLTATTEAPVVTETIENQWWSDEALISVLRRSKEGNSEDKETWILREDRKSRVKQSLQAPPDVMHVAYSEGAVWVWTFHFYIPPKPKPDEKRSIEEILRDTEAMEAQRKARAEVEIGKLFRSRDFKTWEQVMTYKPLQGIWISWVEPLADNKLLFHGRFPTRKADVPYVLGSIGTDGQISIDSVVSTSGLKDSGPNQPHFNDVIRTPKHIIVCAKGHGCFQVFDAITGQFQRFTRCWSHPKETEVHQTNQGLFDDLILAMRPLPDGTILMACREEGFAKGLKGAPPVHLRASPFLFKSTTTFLNTMSKGRDENMKHLESLAQKFPNIVWRILDPATGKWSPTPPPEGAKTKLDQGLEMRAVQLECSPDGSVRNRVVAK